MRWAHKDIRISPHFGRVWFITKEDQKRQVVGSVNRALKGLLDRVADLDAKREAQAAGQTA